MSLLDRATRHAALGDPRRLLIVDHLLTGDYTVAELAQLVDMPGNLLAHHLDVLDDATLITRGTSEGDHRVRYVTLNRTALPSLRLTEPSLDGLVAFVCTHNSARSQFAAALWREATGGQSTSAGTHPADRVHPKAARVAMEFGVDISEEVPTGYDDLPGELDVVVSVCDRAHEAGVPRAGNTLHWSVPDPVPMGTLAAFRSSFEDIARRIEHLSAKST
ncbi:MAG TPA: ArsR family transcriptional regulator [Acidimicrobiia bacterium]